MNYESLILEIAPDLRELLQTIQTINNGHFNRGRTGWIIRQVENPESDYRHSLKVGLAAFYLLGTRHALDMGLSHDFPEIIAPDRTPGEIPPEERKKEELEAMQELKQVYLMEIIGLIFGKILRMVLGLALL